MVRGGSAQAPVPRSDVSFRLDQKTGNFKAAMSSREMQWGLLPEEKQNNELAQKEFRFIKTIIKTKATAITPRHSRSHQRCTAAKDGKLQGSLLEQINAVQYIP